MTFGTAPFLYHFLNYLEKLYEIHRNKK
jgi:hypothetical protein